MRSAPTWSPAASTVVAHTAEADDLRTNVTLNEAENGPPDLVVEAAGHRSTHTAKSREELTLSRRFRLCNIVALSYYLYYNAFVNVRTENAVSSLLESEKERMEFAEMKRQLAEDLHRGRWWIGKGKEKQHERVGATAARPLSEPRTSIRLRAPRARYLRRYLVQPETRPTQDHDKRFSTSKHRNRPKHLAPARGRITRSIRESNDDFSLVQAARQTESDPADAFELLVLPPLQDPISFQAVDAEGLLAGYVYGQAATYASTAVQEFEAGKRTTASAGASSTIIKTSSKNQEEQTQTGVKLKQRKIYDCTMFNEELDLLEARLGELYDAVDAFLIVESNVTLQLQPKRLHLKENWARFAKWHKKMWRYEIGPPPGHKVAGGLDGLAGRIGRRLSSQPQIEAPENGRGGAGLHVSPKNVQAQTAWKDEWTTASEMIPHFHLKRHGDEDAASSRPAVSAPARALQQAQANYVDTKINPFEFPQLAPGVTPSSLLEQQQSLLSNAESKATALLQVSSLTDDFWAMEVWQRNAAGRALVDEGFQMVKDFPPADEDLVMIMDVDEIPAAGIVRKLKRDLTVAVKSEDDRAGRTTVATTATPGGASGTTTATADKHKVQVEDVATRNAAGAGGSAASIGDLLLGEPEPERHQSEGERPTSASAQSAAPPRQMRSEAEPPGTFDKPASAAAEGIQTTSKSGSVQVYFPLLHCLGGFSVCKTTKYWTISAAVDFRFLRDGLHLKSNCVRNGSFYRKTRPPTTTTTASPRLAAAFAGGTTSASTTSPPPLLDEEDDPNSCFVAKNSPFYLGALADVESGKLPYAQVLERKPTLLLARQSVRNQLFDRRGDHVIGTSGGSAAGAPSTGAAAAPSTASTARLRETEEDAVLLKSHLRIAAAGPHLGVAFDEQAAGAAQPAPDEAQHPDGTSRAAASLQLKSRLTFHRYRPNADNFPPAAQEDAEEQDREFRGTTPGGDGEMRRTNSAVLVRMIPIRLHVGVHCSSCLSKEQVKTKFRSTAHTSMQQFANDDLLVHFLLCHRLWVDATFHGPRIAGDYKFRGGGHVDASRESGKMVAVGGTGFEFNVDARSAVGNYGADLQRGWVPDYVLQQAAQRGNRRMRNLIFNKDECEKKKQTGKL